MLAAALGRLLHRVSLTRLRQDRRGNVLVIVGLAMPAILGVMGLAIEGAGWYQVQHSMQNAADAAAVAAATNGTATYQTEANAVTTQYGYQSGVSNVTVVSTNAAACPAGGSNCYKVTITKSVPLFIAGAVGFRGNTTLGSARAVSITASAIATQDTAPRNYCVLALASSGNAVSFQTNGAPKADLTGCSIMSNTGMDCNGHNLGATYGDAHGVNNGCGLTQSSNVPAVSDPYAYLASSIPANTCSSYPQEPTKKSGTPLPSSNLLSGSYAWTGTQTFCGDVQLTGNVTLTGNQTVVVIRNGQLDTNGYTFKTASGAAATVIFSGSNGSYTHAPTGGGTIDIAAPTSGTWSGVALYQDPALTTGVDISAAGNSPTWNITGLTYLPNSSVTFSGAVNKSSNGASCFVIVVDSILINGTGSILDYGNCAAAGLTMPSNPMPVRGRLVS
ncbi:pilus assembly protein TadG-related protein [Sphingobium mellinum]|uniref:pilus assembly protein TadG-related protein n=1 Tax=Sphingobium mellinum TaxID=1387166 RepID=UPI0030EC0D8B